MPRVDSDTLDATARRQHAIDVVIVSFRIRTGFATITYVVFRSRRDALAGARPFPRPRGSVSLRPIPSSFPGPGEIVLLSRTEQILGTRSTAWITDFVFLEGNVATAAVIASSRRGTGASVSTVTALARFALRHLRTIERR